MAGIGNTRRRPDELGLGFPVDSLGEKKRERSEAIESEMGTALGSYPREQAGREEVARRRRPLPSGGRKKKKTNRNAILRKNP